MVFNYSFLLSSYLGVLLFIKAFGLRILKLRRDEKVSYLKICFCVQSNQALISTQSDLIFPKKRAILACTWVSIKNLFIPLFILFCNLQQEGQLCGQHCLNALLQGPYYTAVDLATLAEQLDQEERRRMAEAGEQSDEYRRFINQPSR